MRRLGLAAFLLLPACHFPPLFQSYSLDHQHRLELRLGVRGTVVERDGQPLGRYALVDQDSLRLSASGRHFVYAARKRDGWHLYPDGHEQPTAWDGLLMGSLRLGDDRAGQLAGVMRRGQALFVLNGARTEGPYDAVTALQADAAFAHLAYIARRGSQAFAVIDGQLQGPYQALAELALSPRGGHTALIVRQDERWAVLHDGVARPHDSAAGLRFSASGERLFYVARDGDRERVVAALSAQEQAGPPLPHIDWRSLSVTPDGSAAVYIGEADGHRFVVEHGELGPPYDAVRELSVTASQVGYIGRRDAREQVVIDGQPGPWFSSIGGLALAAGGSGFAYLAQDGPQLRLITHAGARPLSWALAGSLALCTDGSHVGLLGGIAAHALQVLIDGQPVHTFHEDEPEAVRRTLGPQGVQKWIQQELRPHCPPATAVGTCTPHGADSCAGPG